MSYKAFIQNPILHYDGKELMYKSIIQIHAIFPQLFKLCTKEEIQALSGFY